MTTMKSTLDRIAAVQDSFQIDRDLEVIDGTYNTLGEIETLISSQKQQKGDALDQLTTSIADLNDQLHQLRQDVSRLQLESQRYNNKEQLFRENARELESLELENVQLKDSNDTVMNQLIELAGYNENGHMGGPPTALEEEENAILSDPVARANLLRLQLYRSLGVSLDVSSNQLFIASGGGPAFQTDTPQTQPGSQTGGQTGSQPSSQPGGPAATETKIDALSLDDDYSDFYKTKFIWGKIGEGVGAGRSLGGL
ncbi:kinetochore-associated Ndc80 complex subunit SPC24 KNAG_0E02300 [Huiozyma naganishii CBS 8797]|uniref:Kinetochore protein Spc24 n=1 Tax=Huiozyma naganishii (strain ATCC MYA-139 / BCRC 22969 / CBS 8797 / KCTC 17520 / NBRC 10181 / NCYC 3082 / Yp74L-3) TaxID=1071383 RepID=J7S7U2_HUIN7|nr:hypothetical protein KNAG_0E02300 [Kazachstania naganishii CBS 8797]CCK70491.1 hypothetical protein KNAG_0E02300 [Kazachstania naganishii CBS 8797]